MSVRLLLIFVLVSLSGCSWLGDNPPDETRDWPVDRIYSDAHTALASGDYEKAIRYYNIIEARFPFGSYAQQSQLELGYIYYRTDEPDSALVTLDRFLRQNPRHPHADYAYYLKGLTNFNRGFGFFDEIFPRDDTQRDPGLALDSFEDFSMLLHRFPDSHYAGDARQRMLHLKNRIAGYEVHVGRYYIKRGAFEAAANRAKYVIEHFQGTPATSDALSILVASYQKLELHDLADDAMSVLTLNYPDHPGVASPGQVADRELRSWWERLGLDE